jgi:phytoene dehydrogenase-like protein
MRKWAGDMVYEMMWEPMMIGKFGERYSKIVNMAWLWARIKARSTRLGTFQGGFQEFSDRFAGRLREMGVEITLNAPVRSIAYSPAGGLSLDIGWEGSKFRPVPGDDFSSFVSPNGSGPSSGLSGGLAGAKKHGGGCHDLIA